MNVEASREAGPWGGNKAKSWDDVVFLLLRSKSMCMLYIVHAIQVLYQSRDGKSVWSKRHGGGGGGSMCRIKLDCLSDYLVGMMRFFTCTLRKYVSFYMNKEKYGPSGTEIGTAFGCPMSNGKLVGFHGRIHELNIGGLMPFQARTFMLFLTGCNVLAKNDANGSPSETSMHFVFIHTLSTQRSETKLYDKVLPYDDCPNVFNVTHVDLISLKVTKKPNNSLT
ncbi:hypothetical protein JRO89_XS11G0210000 [Xanthoceras sorbifolium]|uniref:Jacalin-type lectin domain-containing protein n=1 Tax=Xanthoceras sorbifolium TaxID=99658 RepID=A0ABQ8HGL7_9ROSI|nr:hypothetical protein JRO89_XS11G0210000 [Xanthoceras sorbifolium]